MAGRQARLITQQRLQQEQQQLAEKERDNPGDEEDDEEGEEDNNDEQQPPIAQRKVNAFALLSALDEDDNDNESEGEGDDNNNNSATTKTLSNKPAASLSTSSSNKKKKNKAKKKNNGKSPATFKAAKDDDEDELERVLRELSMTPQPAASVNTTEAQIAQTLQTVYTKHYAVDSKMLDADAEMRRLFGSRVVNAEMQHRATRGRQARNASSARRSMRKFIFVPPRDTWPPPTQSGLSMELLDTRGGTSYFQLVHAPKYQEIQFLFYDSVDSLDPSNIMHVLNMYPYHVDSLLTLSEVCKHQGDLAMAAEFVERALFSIERGLHPLFNIATGLCRLAFSRTENRSFFLAVFRHVQYLARRACWRTALEYTKLLLSFDPGSDPLGGMQLFDFFALRAREPAAVVSLYRALRDHKKLSLLPNWCYSYALALFQLEQAASDRRKQANHTESSTALLEAMARFPSVILPLAELCAISLPSRCSRHSYLAKPSPVQGNTLNILVTLFVERNSSLWKEPEVMEWWKPQVERLIDAVNAKDALVERNTKLCHAECPLDPLNLYRHVFVSDINKAIGELPGNVSRGSIMMHDPLPPPNSTVGYTRPVRPPRTATATATSNSSGRIGAETTALEAFFRSLLPWSTVDPTLNRDNVQTREPQNQDDVQRILAAAGLQAQDQPLVLDWIRRATQNFVNNGVFGAPGAEGDNDEEEDDEDEQADDD